jgi:hypothetical protein
MATLAPKGSAMGFTVKDEMFGPEPDDGRAEATLTTFEKLTDTGLAVARFGFESPCVLAGPIQTAGTNKIKIVASTNAHSTILLRKGFALVLPMSPRNNFRVFRRSERKIRGL